MVKPKLKVKEAKFVKAKAEGKSNRQAAMEATGARAEIADIQANRMLKNVKVVKAIDQLMEGMGLGDNDLLVTLKEGLHASKTIVMGKEEDSFVDIQPDHANRHKFLETALRLRGHGVKQDNPNNTIIFNQGDLVKSKYVKD